MRYLIVLLVLFFFTASNAQDFWQQLKGPEGGWVGEFFESNNGDFYLVSNSCGINRSVDKGKTWMEITNPYKNINRGFLAFNSKNELFLSSYNEGMQFSNDHGKNWIALNSIRGIQSFFIDNKDRIFIYQNYDVLVSIDHGKSFLNFMNGVGNFMNNINGFYSNSDSIIYISTQTKVWSTTDGGQQWKIDSFGNSISQLWVNEKNIPFILSNQDIYYSSDQGKNWEVLTTPIGNSVYSILTGDESYLFIRGDDDSIYRCELNNQNWNTIDVNSSIYFDRIYLAKDKYLYLSSFNMGFFKYDSISNEISPLHRGLYCQNILGLETNTDQTLLAVTYTGVFRTTNNGNTWDLISISPDSKHYEKQLVHVNKKNNDVYLVSKYNGLFKSTDNGSTWNKIIVCDSCDRITAIGGSDDGELYVGVSRYLYKSTDNGINWEKINTIPFVPIYNIYIDQKGRVFAGSHSKIYESIDNGLTWFDIHSPTGFEIGVNKIFSDMEGNIFLVMMNLPIVMSSDFGKTWNFLNGIIEQSFDFAVLPNGDYMASGGDSRGSVLISQDKGVNWTSNSTGLNGDNSTFFTLDSEGYIYLGTYHTSVFKSTQQITKTNHVATKKDAIQISYNQGCLHLTAESNYQQNFKLSILNLDGKQIKTFSNQQLQSGKNEIEFPLNGLTPGIYFYQMKSENQSYSGKFIVSL